MSPQLAPVVYGIAALIVVGGMLVAARLIRVRRIRTHPSALEPYECGEVPIGPAWKAVPVGFIAFALVFILFDVEVVFLFPWVGAHPSLRAALKTPVLIFVVMLFAGWVHALRRGDLRWTR